MKWWRELPTDRRILFVSGVVTSVATLAGNAWLREQLTRAVVSDKVLSFINSGLWLLGIGLIVYVLWRISTRLEIQEQFTGLTTPHLASRIESLEFKSVNSAVPADDDTPLYRTHDGRVYTYNSIRTLPDEEKVRLMREVPGCWRAFMNEVSSRMSASVNG